MNVRSLSWLKVIPALLLLLSFLPEVEAAQTCPSKLSVEYVYSSDGMLAGRTVNGLIQRFEYDKRGQLLAVKDAEGNDLERYVYDPAGNILSKTVHGRTTRFTYDAANQITSRTNPDGRVIQYQYDAAGRLIQEGSRSYVYGYQDKVEEIRENGKIVARFTYGLDGQLESVTRADGSVEHFYWDGLALIGRGKSTFVNEPYVTGGNPIASDGRAMLNDMLGSTVGVRDGEKMTPVAMTAFGESADQEAMYTGKPHVDGLGYAFLFRNYRAELGKWQSADPLGYPDGWNSLTYCNNAPIVIMDYLGCENIGGQARYNIYVTSTNVALIGAHTAIVVFDTQTNTAVFSVAGYPANYDGASSSGSSSAVINPGNLVAVINADLVIPNNSTLINSVNDFSDIQNLAGHYNPIVPYSLTASGDGFNCNSFTYNALLHLGYDENLINNIPSQLGGWQLGWGKLFPLGVFE